MFIFIVRRERHLITDNETAIFCSYLAAVLRVMCANNLLSYISLFAASSFQRQSCISTSVRCPADISGFRLPFLFLLFLFFFSVSHCTRCALSVRYFWITSSCSSWSWSCSCSSCSWSCCCCCCSSSSSSSCSSSSFNRRSQALV